MWRRWDGDATRRLPPSPARVKYAAMARIQFAAMVLGLCGSATAAPLGDANGPTARRVSQYETLIQDMEMGPVNFGASTETKIRLSRARVRALRCGADCPGARPVHLSHRLVLGRRAARGRILPTHPWLHPSRRRPVDDGRLAGSPRARSVAEVKPVPGMCLTPRSPAQDQRWTPLPPSEDECDDDDDDDEGAEADRDVAVHVNSFERWDAPVTSGPPPGSGRPPTGRP